VKTSALAGEVRKRLEKIAALRSSPAPPDLVLNRHCAECEFQVRCRQKALEKDDLSLLAGMSEKERKKLDLRNQISFIAGGDVARNDVADAAFAEKLTIPSVKETTHRRCAERPQCRAQLLPAAERRKPAPVGRRGWANAEVFRECAADADAGL